MLSPLELKTRAIILRENRGASVAVIRNKSGFTALIGSRIVKAHNAVELVGNVRATDPHAVASAILEARL